MNRPKYNTYEYPDCQGIVVCGDIHGDFNLLVHKVCVQYQMQNTLVIVAGDCGFGFENKGYYDNMVMRNAKRMSEANNRILLIRGNHDNPAFFDGRSFNHNRFIAIPDYSVIKACGHSILCVGGAISVDRLYRINMWLQENARRVHYQDSDKGPFAKNYYWEGEAPIFNQELIETILIEHSIDTVITHTSPSFCELQSKEGLANWAEKDENLIADIKYERAVMDSIYDVLTKNQNAVIHWCYGHFHQSWSASINGTLFKMLDIMELYEIR